MTKVNDAVTDYIIVGAGSAGCVLAHRLSTDPAHQVAIFEAGRRDNSWKIKMPAALTYNLETNRHNWFYHTLPQQHLNQRSLYWPRGKVLGGSSSINAMVYIRGHAEDFNRWQKEGADDWHYDAVLPYFKRAETYSKGANAYRGDQGPLHVVDKLTDNPLFDAFIEAGIQAGYPYTQDVNGEHQEGFGRFDMTIHDGQRCSSAVAYLHPVLIRPNLVCHTQAYVVKILIEKGIAIGIEYIQHGQRKRCYARQEVILAGGAINSPHLLMLSGIGPAEMLRQQHISPIVDLPGVGRNLQDHLEFYMQFACKQPITLHVVNNPLKRMAAGIQWFLSHRGLCASSHLEAGAFIRSHEDVSHPDIQYHFLPGLVNEHQRDNSGGHAFQVHAGTMRPKSTGHLSLASADPFTPLNIEANYFAVEEDLDDFVNLIPLTRDIFQQKAFDPYRGKELQPGLHCRSKDEIKAFLRTKIDSAYHPCGTCKMGKDAMSVVDAHARVYGINNLRVVDASIMPSITSGNLNAPTIMIAEKVSDMIIQAHS